MEMKTYNFLTILLVVVVSKTNHGQLISELLADAESFLIETTRIQPKLFPFYPQASIKNESRYDFIVIGASPSGSVVANRLTENPNVTVLLLEEGEEASFIVDIPVVAPFLEFTSYNYGYKSEPQDGFCKACTDRRMEWPHGKGIGGSSLINFMLYVRGNPHDYDMMSEQGNPGWSYEELLPYFKKIEDTHVKISDPEYRGKGGPLTVSDVPYRSELSNYFVNASVEAGHEYVDYNGKSQIGVSYVQGTIKNGRRCSAETSYLRPIRRRRNLRIQTNSKVTKILVNQNTKDAYGVEYLYKGKRYNAYANKEVILSAGSLNSPQVLMLSGIGPKDHLEELNIPLIKDLPVGQKMFDHAVFPGIIFQVNSSVGIGNILNIFGSPINYLEFLKGSGQLTSIGSVEAISYLKTNVSTYPKSDYPDIELMMLGVALNADFGISIRKVFNIPIEVFDKVFKPLNGNVYQIATALLHPKSYGWIKLNKEHPEGAPLFYANYFSDPENEDIKTFIAGIREAQKINLMPTFQKIGARTVDIPIPGCEDNIFDSDEYWECALRSVIGSYYHQVYTCKMGPKSDPEAVVDNELKVYGVRNLRVVDTSVLSVTPSAHILSIAYVIGEKAADLLKSQWNI